MNNMDDWYNKLYSVDATDKNNNRTHTVALRVE